MPVGAKLRVPLPRRTLLARARLANPLRADGPLPRLVLLAAPPGFGKTTLLTQWLTQPAGAGEGAPLVAWVSLDESDADVQQFLSDLVDAFAASRSGVGAEARALLDADRPAPAEDVLVSLVNELDALAGTTVIALDDLHRAGGPAVHDAVGFLLENLPPRVVVAITTRADPPLPLARLRARGELVEVRAADLRLSTEESDGFLRAVMDLPLDPAQVEALTARTEGWVAGLQLAALSARSRTPSGADAVDDFVRAFTGSHRFVLDYLVEEVLDAQSAGAREFLLLTSVLDRLSGPLCDAVTGSAGGQGRLEQLEAANVFLTALDDDRRWFRYHQLFAEAVRARLVAERPDAVRRLHRAAAGWFADQGLLEDALAHALDAGDPELLADLFECALPGLRRRRRDRVLLRWIGEVPDAVIRERPILATTRAWEKLVGGDPEAARDWLDVAETRLRSSEAPVSLLVGVPDDVAAARADQQRAVGAHIAIYRAALAQAAGDVAETVRQAEAARAQSDPDDHFAHGAAAGFLGLAAWADGDLATAIDTFGSAVEHLGAAGNLSDELGATVVLAEMALANGGPADARRLYERALAAAEQNPVAAATIAADLHVGLADVLREQDELDAAARELATATELGETASLQENRFRRHTARAGLLRATGELDAALSELDAAEAVYLPGFFPATRPLAAVRARVLIGGGRLREARQWAGQRDVRRADPAGFLNEYDLLTFARLLIAERRTGTPSEPGEWDALPGLLATMADAAASRPGSLVDVRTVQALAFDALGETRRAQDALAQALAGGVPSGYRRVFLDEGEPMTTLLRGHASAGLPSSPLARELLDRTSVPVPLRLPVPGAEELSEREVDVLRLLASELSGPEIASRLFVSINTLRTHTKHIFTKLDVRTRRAAVARARERHLL
jgi:LuxR family maltose regulon positive regulatory protein